MVASVKMLHLLEAFSTPWFLYSSPANHHLVFFLLEIFNNIIQYQFDGNSNLVYTIIRKRQVFHALANLPTDNSGINKCLNNRKGMRFSRNSPKAHHEQAIIPTMAATRTQELDEEEEPEDDEVTDEEKSESGVEASMEGSRPALPAEAGTLAATLPDIPGNNIKCGQT
jgi:hypothetical protein